VRTGIALAGAAVGLLVASVVLDDVSVDAGSFLISVVIFAITFALMQPFLFSQFRRRNNTAALGGVALIATFVALLVTDVFTDGLDISGAVTWLGATVVVWVASLLAVFILPYFGLKKYLEEKR
jgi:hypothetical protein